MNRSAADAARHGNEDRDAVARAIVNILEDTSNERDHLELTQRAMLNILDDFEVASSDLLRANEELTHLDELKSEFVAMASHELRTPLTSITGFSSTMMANWDRIEDDEKLTFVGIIYEQSHRLARLVESLLTISRIESGVLETNASTIDLAAAIGQAIQDLDIEDVSVVCEPGLQVVADADHFQQIIVNYVSNARKYGAAPFSVEADMSDGCVTVRVIDHGNGVPTEFVPHLFERFAQGNIDASRSASGGQGKGTGLGLSIVDALIRAQGGEASYEPNEPTGSRFVVRFPRSTVTRATRAT